jgi:hypothetical protein
VLQPDDVIEDQPAGALCRYSLRTLGFVVERVDAQFAVRPAQLCEAKGLLLILCNDGTEQLTAELPNVSVEFFANDVVHGDSDWTTRGILHANPRRHANLARSGRVPDPSGRGRFAGSEQHDVFAAFRPVIRVQAFKTLRQSAIERCSADSAAEPANDWVSRLREGINESRRDLRGEFGILLELRRYCSPRRLQKQQQGACSRTSERKSSVCLRLRGQRRRKPGRSCNRPGDETTPTLGLFSEMAKTTPTEDPRVASGFSSLRLLQPEPAP